MFLSTIKNEIKELHKNNVKFSTIGNTLLLPEGTINGIKEGIDLTINNTGLNLILALNYGSRQEILEAVRNIIDEIKKGELDKTSIDENVFSSFLDTKNYPDPDLLIRTSGELRISNFLLWQLAYTELFFIDKLWPDFRESDFNKIIKKFYNIKRNFGNI